MARRRRWLPVWMVLALVLTVAFPGRAPAWSNIGPPGGEVEEVAVAGPEGEHIYVMTPGGSFWVSDDGGRSFEERARGRFPFYGPFVVDPGDPSHLWAATPGEVVVSRDGGAHWSSFGSFSAAVAVDDMVLDPWIPGAVDVTVAEYGRGASFLGMVRFLPDGSRQVVLDQASGPLAAGDGVLYALRAGELVQSSDGKNWDGAADPGVEAITALAVDPGDGRHVVAGGPKGLAVSLDGGATWRKTEIHERVHAVVLGLGVAWCATGAGLWISTSDGLWWDRTSLQGGWLACVAADPSDQGTVYVGTREAPAGFDRPGLMRSSNFGQSFRMSDSGIVATGAFSVSLAATGASPRLLALADGLRLVAWNGNGSPWRVLGPGDGARVYAFSRDPGDDRRLLAVASPARGSHEAALYVSENGGSSWDRRSGFKSTPLVYALSVDPYSANRVYGVDGFQISVFHPQDGTVETPFFGAFGAASVVAPKAFAGVVLVAGRGVWRSVDSGETWEAVDPSSYWEVHHLESSGVGPIYLINGTWVVRSDDGGLTWVPRGTPGEWLYGCGDLAVSPANPDLVLMACAPDLGNEGGWGVFLSGDGGVHWRRVPGPPGLWATTVDFDPDDPGVLLVGTAGHGIWKGPLVTAPRTVRVRAVPAAGERSHSAVALRRRP